MCVIKTQNFYYKKTFTVTSASVELPTDGKRIHCLSLSVRYRIENSENNESSGAFQ